MNPAESIDHKHFLQHAYDFVGKYAAIPYDDMMSASNWLGRFALRLFWRLPADKYRAFRTQMFAGLPADFKGRLLEVPVGTGVLSLPRYKDLLEADITCLDYSSGMLGAAYRRAEELDLTDITFQQGDVGFNCKK